MPVRLTLMILSTFLIAFGIHLYVPTNLIPLAGEGAMLAISEKYNKKFSSVKLVFDASMVVVSLITCLVLLHNIGSVGIGTIIAAFCVGIELKWITKIASKHKKSFPEQSTNSYVNQTIFLSAKHSFYYCFLYIHPTDTHITSN
ncbi:MAG: hypothetical protein J6B68_05760 [Lachnospiraceae bacterium]|nr:hypothetical protein [Lachnospiraceae bacterium]